MAVDSLFITQFPQFHILPKKNLLSVNLLDTKLIQKEETTNLPTLTYMATKNKTISIRTPKLTSFHLNDQMKKKSSRRSLLIVDDSNKLTQPSTPSPITWEAPKRTSTTTMSTLSSDESFSNFRLTELTNDELPEEYFEYDVYLWHQRYLNVVFSPCNLTGYPCVEDPTDGNKSLPGMCYMNKGDYLIQINRIYSTHAMDMEYSQVMSLIESGVRPAVLRFRRKTLRGSFIEDSINLDANMNTRRRSISATRQLRRTEQSMCYVIWREEDPDLGITWTEQTRGNPRVAAIDSKVVERETKDDPLCIGDILLSINHNDVQAMGYEKAMMVLKVAPRPLVLKFLRESSRGHPREGHSF